MVCGLVFECRVSAGLSHSSWIRLKGASQHACGEHSGARSNLALRGTNTDGSCTLQKDFFDFDAFRNPGTAHARTLGIAWVASMGLGHPSFGRNTPPTAPSRLIIE